MLQFKSRHLMRRYKSDTLYFRKDFGYYARNHRKINIIFPVALQSILNQVESRVE